MSPFFSLSNMESHIAVSWIWLMGDENLNILHTFYGIILLERCLPTTYEYHTVYYGLQRMKGEQGLLAQHKKSSIRQGLDLSR
jgi:hypothetical protein